MALKVRTIKLDDETWERWQARASVASTSVSALIVQSMEGQAPGPDVNDILEALRVVTEAPDAEIAQLNGLLTSAHATIGQLEGDVAALKRELAKRPLAVERHHLNEVTQPSMTRVDLKLGVSADPASKKPVAAILPVTGSQFPRQLTWAQKAALKAAKGKRNHDDT